MLIIFSRPFSSCRFVKVRLDSLLFFFHEFHRFVAKQKLTISLSTDDDVQVNKLKYIPLPFSRLPFKQLPRLFRFFPPARIHFNLKSRQSSVLFLLCSFPSPSVLDVVRFPDAVASYLYFCRYKARSLKSVHQILEESPFRLVAVVASRSLNDTRFVNERRPQD